MSIMRKASGAPIEMRKRGKITDSKVLDEIEKRPGATVSEIAGRLMVSNGKVDGSITRLASRGKIAVKHCIRRGILVKMVYPKTYLADQHDVVRIPKEMIDESAWKAGGILYALSRSTVGIAPESVRDWDRTALFKEALPIKRDKENIIIRFPERLSYFYQLENSEIDLSTIGNNALITVETVLPVKLPITYPEETQYRLTRTTVLFVKETIEAIPTFDPLASYIFRKGRGRVTNTTAEHQHWIERENPNEHVLTEATSEHCSRPMKIPVKV